MMFNGEIYPRTSKWSGDEKGKNSCTCYISNKDEGRVQLMCVLEYHCAYKELIQDKFMKYVGCV